MAQATKQRLGAKSAQDAGDIDVGRRVLRIEAAGLQALADVLDESFIAALDILAGVKDRGRVICKSRCRCPAG